MPRKKTPDYDFNDSRLCSLLTQEEGAELKDLTKDLKLVGYAVTHPRKMPLLIADIASIKPEKSLRIALISIQIDADTMAVKALQIMQEKNITQILVTDKGAYAGVVHFHDLLKEGII